MGSNAQFQLERMSNHDKQALEKMGMKLYDEQGKLRLWENIVNDFMNDVWGTLSEEQKENALVLAALIQYRLEHGFTWD